MKSMALGLVALLGAAAAQAADPVRIGITTILSGPTADRGQSEQYGAQLALNHVNETGGVLGRPVEAYYADNACKPAIGVPATERLIKQEHVPVIIGALCTPVTHAIMPVILQAKVPLIIATSPARISSMHRALAAMRMPLRPSRQKSISRAACSTGLARRT